MECSVEDRARRRGGSPVVIVNVMLLAVLTAVLAFGVSNGTALAHDSGARATSVQNLQLRVASTSIEYTDARDAAIGQWKGKSPVNIFWSSNPTVVFYQDNNSRGDDACGMYIWHDATFDEIYFYKYNILRFNFDLYDKRWVGVHELGHALRLNHSDSTQTPYNSIMYSLHSSGTTQPWTPQRHDLDDVNRYW